MEEKFRKPDSPGNLVFEMQEEEWIEEEVEVFVLSEIEFPEDGI